MATSSKIIWTKIDEAPALASYSFTPIVQAFTKGTGVEVETRYISLAGRIIATFPERLSEAQRIADNLTQLGELTLKPEANIIKLPNVSASVPRSSRKRSRNCRARATTCPTTRKTRKRTKRRKSSTRVIRRCSAPL